ncbi:protein lplB [Niallia circulans]|jgi:putative aldouronate transport system permease protein|uniref:Protein lplB n=1 Tax=Niallia circulans TaxID=1397 RepID=A0A0J1ICA8_NIACI|nr:ABC transporter permease subunit [Niallia circulans]KLV23614.1 protein lplB [Niallia circulans]MCM2981814.1 ABC transporter permease subunit [Niallia circulans]MDR4316455.1 sugar ABC transporter permease [Niallia circulans]MED3838372.1 ABC transporter permease subunit [Niallia circulans]MED4243847.1 ABC transporter permease subunit [Niallia circulans]
MLETVVQPSPKKVSSLKKLFKKCKEQKELVLLSIPFVIYALIFYYAPLSGWLMAFQNYRPGRGIFEQEWVGLNNFKFLFSDPTFINVVRNTLAMSMINLVLGFIFSIGFALLLNEVRNKTVKKFMQTVSYLPHFLSWIIVTGIVMEVLSPETGIINQLLLVFGIIDAPINFFADPKYFWWIVGFANVWKSTGWGSIIYLAAMASINEELYEAASIDGANRLRKIWHVTLPGIKPTIFILLLINIGNILNAGFEVQYLLGNGLVQGVSQTIDIFVLKYGISLNNYSLATAAGIFNGIISLTLIFIANHLAKAAGEERLF